MTAFAFAGRNYAEVLGVIQRPASLFDGRRSGLYVQTLAIHREVLKKVGEFDTNLPFGEDTDFFFRLALETPLCYVNKPLVNIDRTESRSDSLVELMVRDEQLRLEKRQYLYEKWLSFLGSDNEYLRKRVLEWIAETHNDRANSHLFAHEYAKACRAISQSLSARFSVKAAAKLALTATVPSLARRAYISRELKRTQERITA